MSEDGSVSNTDPLANDANAAEGENVANAEGGENVANAEGGENVANAEGGENVANAEGNGEELSNLVNDGSANAASAENPAADPAFANNAGEDPFATPANGAANAAETDPNATALNNGSGMSNGTDPFAPTNGSNAVSAESTPANPAAGGAEDPALLGAAPMNGTDPAAAPMNGTDPAAAPMNGADPAAAPTDAAPVNGVAADAGMPADASAPTEPAPATEEAAPAPVASAPAAAGGYVPENGSTMPYYIQKGDTLAVISTKIYGTPGKWKQLATANNLSDPNKIYAGDVIYYTLNDSSRGFADKYESAARQSVTVAQGDTLASISAKVYGSEGSWRTLWKENPSVKNPDIIRPGQVLFYRAQAATAVNGASEEGVASSSEE